MRQNKNIETEEWASLVRQSKSLNQHGHRRWIQTEGTSRPQRRRGRKQRKTTHGELFLPILLDGQIPFPGEVVVLVVVGELGLDDVGAAGDNATR